MLQRLSEDVWGEHKGVFLGLSCGSLRLRPSTDQGTRIGFRV